MNITLKLFIFILLKSQIDCSVKIWRKNDPIEQWSSVNTEPNECMRAVFNKEVEGFIFMDETQHLNEVILPSDGAIVFSSGSNIQFSDNRKCDPAKIQETKLRTAAKRLWFSTKSWQTQDENENVAKPDIYKIPCECDIVEFPREYMAAIDLEFVDEIVVNKILINDRTDNFERFLETTIGQKMFLNSDAVHFTQGLCNPPKYCGCHNHNRFEKYTELLCGVESKFCPEPHCLQPIQPKGHCCPICGAILNFKIKDTCDFNITNMSEVGRKLKRFRNGKYVNKLHYYAGMVPGDHRDDNYVQLVVAEVDEYTGVSVEFINFLAKDDRFKEDNYRTKLTSGEPYIRGKSSALSIVFLSLLFVLSIYAVIYIHYMRQPKYESWIPISRLNVLRKSIAFARFENRSAEDENDTVNVGVRYEVDVDDCQSESKSVNDFNNPLYERDRDQRVTLGSVETEMLQPTTSQSITDESPSMSSADISLVDISLKSIED